MPRVPATLIHGIFGPLTGFQESLGYSLDEWCDILWYPQAPKMKSTFHVRRAIKHGILPLPAGGLARLQ